MASDLGRCPWAQLLEHQRDVSDPGGPGEEGLPDDGRTVPAGPLRRNRGEPEEAGGLLSLRRGPEPRAPDGRERAGGARGRVRA